MNGEIWKNIINDYIQVSNLGNIRKINADGIIENITPLLTSNGNPYILIENKMYLIKRLVALMFVCNENNHKHILHIDGNIVNNNADNLKWYDPLTDDNIKSKTRKIYLIDIYTDKPIALFRSIKIASKVTGIKNNIILKCCNKELIQYGGYKWRYAD